MPHVDGPAIAKIFNRYLKESMELTEGDLSHFNTDVGHMAFVKFKEMVATKVAVDTWNSMMGTSLAVPETKGPWGT